MAYDPYQYVYGGSPASLKRRTGTGTSATVNSGPGYTQAQVDASLAANPNAAGNPNGMYPVFGSAPGLTGYDLNPTSPTFGTSPASIDWGALIQNDPGFKQTQADLKAANVADLAGRNAAFNRAVINYGAMPDMAAAQQALGLDLGSVIDPQTAQLAQQNAYSTEANLQHGFQQGIMKLRQALAARGALQSGELGYQLSEANRSYGNAQNTALQNLLDALSGYQSQYANAVNSRQGTSTQALVDALSRVLSQYGNTAGGPAAPAQAPSPPPPPSTSPTAPTTKYEFTGGNTSQAYPKSGPYIGTAPKGYALG